MGISNRSSDVVYSRQNFSILSVSSLSEPSPVAVAPSDLFVAIDQYFPPTSGPVDSNLTDFEFISFLDSYFMLSADMATAPLVVTWVRALVTLPLLLFQLTGLNPNLSPSPYQPVPGFPPAFTNSAELAQRVVRAYIPSWTVFVYIFFTLLIYLWCIGGMYVGLLIPSPAQSGIEVIDFTSKVVVNPDKSLENLLAETAGASTSVIQEKLEDEALFLRNVHISGRNPEEWHGVQPGIVKSALTLSNDQGTRLRKSYS